MNDKRKELNKFLLLLLSYKTYLYLSFVLIRACGFIFQFHFKTILFNGLNFHGNLVEFSDLPN